MLGLILINRPVKYVCSLSGLVQVDKNISIIRLWLPDYSGTQMASNNQVALMPLRGDHWMKILRLAWYATFAAALGVFIASIPGFFILGPGGIADPRFSANSSPLILSLAWIVRGAAMATGVLVISRPAALSMPFR
jgi:hypothetical protein